jgi:hypothetical protein
VALRKGAYHVNPELLTSVEKLMAGHGKPKQDKPSGRRGGADAQAAAEQAREAREREQAQDAEASNRDRMIEIGRGNKQAGRQTKS